MKDVKMNVSKKSVEQIFRKKKNLLDCVSNIIPQIILIPREGHFGIKNDPQILEFRHTSIAACYIMS